MKSIETRLAWLAGIIDGEGSIAIRFPLNANGNPTFRYVLSIENTDSAMLDEIRAIARELRVGHSFVGWRVRKGRKSSPTARVEFVNAKRIAPILKAVLPYLVTKRERAEHVLNVIEHRTLTGKTPVASDPVYLKLVKGVA